MIVACAASNGEDVPLACVGLIGSARHQDAGATQCTGNHRTRRPIRRVPLTPRARTYPVGTGFANDRGMAGRAWVGCSGWDYPHWRARFHAAEVPRRLWLESYAQAFDCVELNNSFYRLPAPETFAGWASRVPPGFVFAVKASRYL